MSADSSKLRQQQQQQAEVTHQQEQAADTQFDSVEEMIRADVAQNRPSDSVAERLKESIAKEPKPARSWWRRWFG